MPVYRDDAIVLRTQKLGEADRIVTLLTRRNGRVRAVAKGVRRTGSRLGSRVEPFTHVDLMLHTATVEAKRGLDTVTQADTIAAYGAKLVGDYPRYTAGTAMLETAERLAAEEREPSIRLFLLLVGGLRSLAMREHAAGLVLDAFILRGLALSGYEPALAGCAICGDELQRAWFAVQAGGFVCAEHRAPGAATVSPGALALLPALLTSDWDVADGAEDAVQRETSGLVAAYLQWHLERGLRSLRLVERA